MHLDLFNRQVIFNTTYVSLELITRYLWFIMFYNLIKTKGMTLCAFLRFLLFF